MGFQAINKYLAVFFILLDWHEVLLTHGRQLKPMNNKHSSLNTETLGPKDNVQPALPPSPSIHVPPSAENKAASPESPKYHVVVAGSGDVNAFRPTTPGSSPGVGHKRFAGQETKLVVHSPEPDVDSVTEGFKNDFRPTDPGHSGGVGHARENIHGDGGQN